jgi:transmembrane sensor
MKTDKEYLTQLVLFEISGKIREDEKAELHKIIEDDPEAADLYSQLHTTWQNDHLPEAGSNWGADEVWKAIHNRKRQRVIGGSLKGLAVVFTVFVAGFLWLKIPGNMQTPSLAATNGHVKLLLSGGQLVDLSQQEGDVLAGNVALKNNNRQLHFTNNSDQVQFATITVPAGKEYTVHLPDGSTVTLNAETQLFFPLYFSGNTREITIRGEAYLKIAALADKPFLVHLPASTVQVLGTEFNVNTYDSSRVKVALVKGAVKINTERDTVSLKPGDASALIQGKGLEIYKFDKEDVLAWRQGLHLFNKASAEEVAVLIHRFYGISVQLDLKPEHSKTFTGSINRNKPVASFLEGLKFSKYLDYYFEKDSILHLRPI